MQARRAAVSAVCLGLLQLAGCGGGGVSDAPSDGGPTGFTAALTLTNPGTAADHRFGSSIALCDWDGDGRKDLVVGVPGASNGNLSDAGKVLLFVQRPDGTYAATPTRTILPTNWVGGTAGQAAEFGATVECGDFNGDGLADLVIGAPGDAVGAAAGAGRVYLLANNAPTHAGVTFGPYADPNGAVAGGGFGGALAVGRVDADAYADLAVGAPFTTVAAHPGAGRVSVMTGSATLATFGAAVGIALSHATPSDDANFGAAVEIGDIDGDGAGDVIVGVPGQVAGSGGEVRIYGHFPTLSLARSLTVATPGVSIEFGSSLAAADLDGDGDVDLLVGAPFGDVGTTLEAGYVVPFRNTSPASATLVAGAVIVDRTPQGGAQFGDVVLVTGDVSGDGRPDCVVAAPAATYASTAGAGTLTLFRNAGAGAFLAPGAADVYAAATPTTDGAHGAALAASDLDNDSIPDLVVGAPGPLDAISPQPGQVEVLHTR